MRGGVSEAQVFAIAKITTLACIHCLAKSKYKCVHPPVERIALISPMDASSDSEFVTALIATPTSEHATTSSSTSLFSARSESVLEGTESDEGCTSIEEQIEHSKSHWSELAQMECDIDSDDEDAVRADNVRVFKELQRHPTWGKFFHTFGYDLGIWKSVGELEIGEKFAEGGQAELYHAHVTWRKASNRERDVRRKREWVLKVFKQGTLLRQLKAQWPEGYLQFIASLWEKRKLKLPQGLRYNCDVVHGILLKDGRFAFLMGREDEDLRSRIDHHMALETNQGSGPFSKRSEELMMYSIAQGMDWLHSLNIVHRDLKASNVLYTLKDGSWGLCVADFECSIGVIGTGFFRAPEILQACKERNASQRPELFTKKGDVYSYGMTCYEILTGKLPFEGHPLDDFDLVLEGQRPEVPDYVDDWARELLRRCWQSNPQARPTFGEILEFIVANSASAEEDRRYHLDILAPQKE